MGWFPRFISTMECSESPTHILLRLAPLTYRPSALQYQFGTHHSLPRWLRAATMGQGTLIKRGPTSPLFVCELETPALPRFPGCPYALALLTDPGRITPPSPNCGRCDVACWAFKTISSYIFVISGLNHTARAFTVYASQPGSPHHARLATDLLAKRWSHGTLIRWATMQSF